MSEATSAKPHSVFRAYRCACAGTLQWWRLVQFPTLTGMTRFASTVDRTCCGDFGAHAQCAGSRQSAPADQNKTCAGAKPVRAVRSARRSIRRAIHTNNPPTAQILQPPTTSAAPSNRTRRRTGLPVEFFARVIWQESRFNARAVSAKGAQGIAQFMPRTADYRGLIDPFDPIEALKNSASYLHDLKTQVRQSRACRGGLQCRAGAGQRLPCEQTSAAGRDAQLCRDHHRLDGGRLGVAVAATDGGDHDPAGHAVHAARQSDPGAEGRAAAHRGIRAALGHAAHRQLVGEQGLGDLSRDAEDNMPR